MPMWYKLCLFGIIAGNRRNSRGFQQAIPETSLHLLQHAGRTVEPAARCGKRNSNGTAMELQLDRVRQLRRKKGYSQEYMGEKLGISQPYYGRMENGTRTMSFSRFLQICVLLRTSPTGLLDNVSPRLVRGGLTV